MSQNYWKFKISQEFNFHHNLKKFKRILNFNFWTNYWIGIWVEWGLGCPQNGGRLAGSHAQYKSPLIALDCVQCSIGMTKWLLFIFNFVGPINPKIMTLLFKVSLKNFKNYIRKFIRKRRLKGVNRSQCWRFLWFRQRRWCRMIEPWGSRRGRRDFFA